MIDRDAFGLPSLRALRASPNCEWESPRHRALTACYLHNLLLRSEYLTRQANKMPGRTINGLAEASRKRARAADRDGDGDGDVEEVLEVQHARSHLRTDGVSTRRSSFYIVLSWY